MSKEVKCRRKYRHEPHIWIALNHYGSESHKCPGVHILQPIVEVDDD